MIEAFSLLVAVVAVAALLIGGARRRRFAARFTALIDDAERLAEGGRAVDGVRAVEGVRDADRFRPAGPSATPPPAPRRGGDPDAALARFSRALDRLAVRAAHDVAAVEAERRKLDEILAGVPEGVLVTTSERLPIYANRAFRDLFEVDPAASTAELLALVRRPQVHDALGRAIAGEVGPAVELALDGREVAVTARPLEGATGILLMARDVTEVNRLTRMRRDFVTNLSHEIKTPLAVIRGAAETLQETGPEDAAAAERFVRRIIEQIYRLEDLLKDLLTLARLESPEATRRRQPVDLEALCRRAVEVLAPLAGREGVTLRSSTRPVPALQGDAIALERMVINLLVNGIQYNRPGGRVELRLGTAGRGAIASPAWREASTPGDRDPAGAEPTAAEAVVLEVEDDGIGIAESELPRIFERFYRVDKGRGRAEGGSGLGLAIVKHVAQSHGGAVEVASAVDRGSRFRVLLPVQESFARAAAPEAARASAGRPAGAS